MPPERESVPFATGRVTESGAAWRPFRLGMGWIPTALLAGLVLIAAGRLAKVVHGCLHLQRVKQRSQRLSPAMIW